MSETWRRKIPINSPTCKKRYVEFKGPSNCIKRIPIKTSCSINAIEIEIELIQARNLVAKDPKIFGRKGIPDTYAMIYWGGVNCGRSKTIDSTVCPKWNETFKIRTSPTKNMMQQIIRGDCKYRFIDIVLFDYEICPKDNPLGSVSIPLNFVADYGKTPAIWYKLGVGRLPNICRNVSGEIEVKVYLSFNAEYKNNLSSSIDCQSTTLLDNFFGKVLTVHLGWEQNPGTDRKKIDKMELHASTICFDGCLNLIDITSFNDTKSKDGAIRHGGADKSFYKAKFCTFAKLGEDMNLALDHVNKNIMYICLVLNSFRGRNIDKIPYYDLSFHLPETNANLIQCSFAKSNQLGKHSALLMCCLHRNPIKGVWILRTFAEVARGTTTNHLVDALQDMLHQELVSCTPAPTRHSTSPRANLVKDC